LVRGGSSELRKASGDRLGVQKGGRIKINVDVRKRHCHVRGIDNRCVGVFAVSLSVDEIGSGKEAGFQTSGKRHCRKAEVDESVRWFLLDSEVDKPVRSSYLISSQDMSSVVLRASEDRCPCRSSFMSLQAQSAPFGDEPRAKKLRHAHQWRRYEAGVWLLWPASRTE
jgi:hypothetical protein